MLRLLLYLLLQLQ